MPTAKFDRNDQGQELPRTTLIKAGSSHNNNIRLSKIGLTLYAVSIMAIGVIHFAAGTTPLGLFPMPESISFVHTWAFTAGTLLLILAIGLFLPKYRKKAAFTLGVFLLLLMIIHHSPLLVAHPENASEWAAVFELLCLASGAFFIADDTITDPRPNEVWKAIRPAANTGKYIFALALLSFGVEHYIYVQYISTLIPDWMPGKMIWAYIVMLAFVAVAISILLNKMTYLSLVLLGCMFSIWVLILHGPRVIVHLSTEPEWTSLFVAMSMSGLSFVFASHQVKNILKHYDEEQVN